jgi:hypothetical protein
MAVPHVDWARYLTTNRCRLCADRITRHDDWIDCDGWAEHRSCHEREDTA